VAGEGRCGDDDPGAEVVLRPEFVVLDDAALVTAGDVLRPPPVRFTHEVVVDEPYHLDVPDRGSEPDGVLGAGTRVTLLEEGEDRCRVADGSGLSVEVRRASLRKLPDGPSG
jgi:hypothetical protein